MVGRGDSGGGGGGGGNWARLPMVLARRRCGGQREQWAVVVVVVVVGIGFRIGLGSCLVIVLQLSEHNNAAVIFRRPVTTERAEIIVVATMVRWGKPLGWATRTCASVHDLARRLVLKRLCSENTTMG